MGKPADFTGAKLLGPEYKVSNRAVGLYGRIDELWLTPDNGLLIVDTKAGLPRAVPQRYAVQLMLYGLAAMPLMRKHGFKLHPRAFIRWEHNGQVAYSPVDYPDGKAWLQSLASWTQTTKRYLELKQLAGDKAAVIARDQQDLFWCEQHGSLLTIEHMHSPGMTTWLTQDSSILPKLMGAIIRPDEYGDRVVPDIRGGVLFTDALGGHWYATVFRHERSATGLLNLLMTFFGMPRFSYAMGYWQKVGAAEVKALKAAGGGYVPVETRLPRKRIIPQIFLQSDLPS
jgi:hypothetical protein